MPPKEPEDTQPDANTTPSADLIAEAMTQYFRDSALGRIVDLPRWVQ
jgi:hypothetical protein